ncbi:MAG: YhfC family glutamic-type intramembrane protease [Anaerolineae bacterium]
MQNMFTGPMMIGYALAIAFEILFPFVLGAIFWRRLGARWRTFFIGMLIFGVTQLLIRVPIVQMLSNMLADTLRGSPTLAAFWGIALALTAGLFEETGRWLGYRYLLKGPKTWTMGVMYGTGHEAMESVWIGVSVMASLATLMNFAAMSAEQIQSLSPDAVTQLQAGLQQLQVLGPATPLVGAYERALTMAVQISLSILVLQVFIRGSFIWYWAAVGYHALIDAFAVFGPRYIGLIGVEAVLTVFAIFSLWIIFHFRPHPETPAETPTEAAAATGGS